MTLFTLLGSPHQRFTVPFHQALELKAEIRRNVL